MTKWAEGQLRGKTATGTAVGAAAAIKDNEGDI